VSNKTYDQLTTKRQKFVDLLVKGQSRVDAYLGAGFKGAPRTCRSNARNLFFELQHVIHDQILKRIEAGGILGVNTVLELAKSAESEAVRLQAADRLIKMSKYDTPEKRVIFVQPQSDQETDQELAELLRKAGLSKADADPSQKKIH
jgi:hypothetical protein